MIPRPATRRLRSLLVGLVALVVLAPAASAALPTLDAPRLHVGRAIAVVPPPEGPMPAARSCSRSRRAPPRVA